MTLRGIGIDVASVSRIGALVDRYGDRFVLRWFDPSEFEGVPSGSLAVHLAGRIAVKEAVWKALRLDTTGPLAWREIVVTGGERGDGLAVRLLGSLATAAGVLGVERVTASAAMYDGVAVAIALAEDADTLLEPG